MAAATGTKTTRARNRAKAPGPAVEETAIPEPGQPDPQTGPTGEDSDFLAPVEDDPAPDHYRHTQVDGSTVVANRPVPTGLTNVNTGGFVYLTGTRVLTLADGRRAYACADCDFVGQKTMTDKDTTPVIGTRGEVRVHRHERHGAGRLGARPGRRGDGRDDLPMGVDPVATQIDPGVLAMELGDIVALAMTVTENERTLGALLADRDQWKVRALEAEREIRAIRKALGKFLPMPETGEAGSE